MQFDIYRKWNERLFQETFLSYQCGRTMSDPSDGWYKGELWFFDNYVIPLANKLKDCGVFGVSSAECLTYATENRARWEAEGEQIVADMLATHLSPKSNADVSPRRRKKIISLESSDGTYDGS